MHCGVADFGASDAFLEVIYEFACLKVKRKTQETENIAVLDAG
jgi:hypothetical protein